MSDTQDRHELLALTHLDGRNGRKLESLRKIFSEYTWMKARLLVMVDYIAFLYPIVSGKKFTSPVERQLLNIHASFSPAHARVVKNIESRLNHDLKAIEVFLVDTLKRDGLSRFIPYVNLGIGSEDINNIAYALMLTESMNILTDEIRNVCVAILKLSAEHAQTFMIARTHAQPSSITTFGKECANTLHRICDEYEIFSTLHIAVKCSGEVGTYQAHHVVDMQVDWIKKTDEFIASFGLSPIHSATQIAPYDSYSRVFQSIARLNTILLDFVQNLWLFLLLGYVRVIPVVAEVGSAGMPHKVNPIHLEGAEGNLKMANMIFEGLARELPVNRLQRSFADSTMRRNIVLPLSLTFLAYQSITEGLKRIVVDRKAILKDLLAHPEVFLESIKAYGLSRGIGDMYERLKIQTRGKMLTRDGLSRMIQELPLTEDQKEEMTHVCTEYANPYPARMVAGAAGRVKKLFRI